jgi:hypothetical protein
MPSLPNTTTPTGLTCRRVGEHGIDGICNTCGDDLCAAGRVLLPEGGQGRMQALCGSCLRADAEAFAAVAERGVTFLEALLLALTAHGCRPRSVASTEAAA